MISTFRCPNCQQLLSKELHPRNAPKPYVQLWCTSRQCHHTAAQWEGGSGPTEENAYRSLCAAVDNETEQQCEPWEGESILDRKEQIEAVKAERKRDR
jgi:hypothetical protein